MQQRLSGRQQDPGRDRGPGAFTTPRVCPASSGQKRLWFLDQADPGTAVYNLPLAFRTTGRLDVSSLAGAFETIVRRHEVLRTTFQPRDDGPVQVIHPPYAVDIPVVDLSGQEPHARQEEMRRHVREEARRPFDLSSGPLLRVRLLRLGPWDHVLLVTLHHIVCDGWSMGVLFGELAEIYNGSRERRPVSLEEPTWQYADFTRHEAERASGPEVQAQIQYWKRRLAGAPELALPFDRPRPAAPSSAGGLASLALAPALGAAITAFARRMGSTPFMTCLAGFAALLHRYGAGEDIVIGTPLANRAFQETQRLVGFVANTAALRLDLAGDPSFERLLGRARETVVAAIGNQEAPFDKVVESVRTERRGSLAPLVQVMVTLDAGPPALAPMHGLASTWVAEHNGTAKFDLTLALHGTPDVATAELEYSRDLFDEATAAQMLRHFERLLEGAVRTPSAPISRLPLLSPDERRQIVEERNRTRTDYPRDVRVERLVAERAARHPLKIAVIEGDRRLTYSELDRRADQLAARLRRHGVVPATRVCVGLPRGIDQVVAVLSILKAGGVYVPLDPGDPPARLASVIADTGATVAVAGAAGRGLLPAGVTMVCVDEEETVDGGTSTAGDQMTRGNEEAHAPGTAVIDGGPGGPGDGDSPAYIMYTSGSTGRPKGVVVRHRGIARLVLATNYVAFSEDDVVVHASNPAFDAATFEVWGALLSGATLFVMPAETLLSPARLRADLERSGATVMFLTTSLFHQVARQDPSVFRGLRYVLFGGEAADVRAVAAVLEHGRPAHLVNGYGPTETTTFATTCDVTAVRMDHTVPIGRPIANTTAFVLDRHMEPVPVGVPGELYVGGDGVACGYHGRPELTAERFVRDPFSGRPDATLYRTGDLVRYRRDGNLEFLGRLDRQVKVRGFRVELGEIESVLQQHPAVSEACVLSDSDEAGVVKLSAYVASTSETVTPNGLREFLLRLLPGHMVPAEIVVLEALPLNANGKLDRNRLKSLAAPPRTAGLPPVLPRDPLEAILAEIWEELLGVRPLGVHDDFFELGGHSLLAARMMDRAEQALGSRLPLSTMMHHSTVASLAAAWLSAEAGAADAPMVTLNGDGPRRPFFFFHGDVNGGGLYARGLARHMDRCRPFHVVQPIRLGNGVPIAPTIESLARCHLGAIRAAQPHGPYLLGGFCNGGLIAYEVARQLAAIGEEVLLVALVDAWPVGAGSASLHRLMRPWWKLTAATDAARADSFLRAADFVHRLKETRGREGVRWLLSRGRRLARGAPNGSLPHDTAAEEPPIVGEPRVGGPADVASRHSSETYAAYYKAVMAYVPGRYHGAVALLVADDDSLPTARMVGDWRRAASHVTVHRIAGRHLSTITTHVESLAAVLDACLSAADRDR